MTQQCQQQAAAGSQAIALRQQAKYDEWQRHARRQRQQRLSGCPVASVVVTKRFDPHGVFGSQQRIGAVRHQPVGRAANKKKIGVQHYPMQQRWRELQQLCSGSNARRDAAACGPVVAAAALTTAQSPEPETPPTHLAGCVSAEHLAHPLVHLHHFGVQLSRNKLLAIPVGRRGRQGRQGGDVKGVRKQGRLR